MNDFFSLTWQARTSANTPTTQTELHITLQVPPTDMDTMQLTLQNALSEFLKNFPLDLSLFEYTTTQDLSGIPYCLATMSHISGRSK